MMRVKKGDTVVVIAGKDKGKKGKVLKVFPKTQRVIVEGVNMVTKHQKPNAKVQQGGIIHQEAAIHISNVMPFDAKAGKGVRVGFKVLEDGTKVRISRKTGEEI
ncbi:large subunit ribosomal protein L24 [Tepidibacter thalassicus DSM 15285]|uniref:Large ribosomal subunit protein uL24 n=2 Tax=Tepidibacter TaxID=214904 RepID=A0A1M5T441_9FIRM|nr:large subunit ribosomal protein L24 [Tepidibacter thalassicus DSM 15285]